MHIHVSVLDAMTVFIMVVLVGAVWRAIAARYASTPWGQAMAALYS